MKKDLISVIVPIYNVEKYLKRCIDSIINQTYKNLEIILVDDGATDACGEICDEYAKRDDRVKVIHQENGGVSQARNVGLNNANGKYISFIDSDDCIEKDMMLELIKGIKEDGIDLSVCGYQKKFLDNSVERNNVKNSTIDKIKFLEALFYNGKYKYNYQGYIFNKLFKKEIIKNNGIKFNKKIVYNEDRLFVYEYINSCNGKISLLNYIGYNYFERINSAMGQTKYKKQMITEFMAFDIMSKIAQNNKDCYLDDIIRAEYVNHSLYIYIKYYYNLKDEVIEYKNMALKNVKQVFFSKNIKLKVKLQIIKKYIKLIQIEKRCKI